MLGSATLTTVLSSIAIASAKHIVSRTMPLSRAFSPSNPNIEPPRRGDPHGQPRRSGCCYRRVGRVGCGASRVDSQRTGYPGHRWPSPILTRPMLELDDLHRRFGDVVALDGVSFAVP